MELDDLKKKFDVLHKKYQLPSFDELNREFDVGKIELDSGNLVRDIRRGMMEKVVHYIRLAELMVNPSQASPIFLVMLKEINTEDRKAIDAVLKNFVELEINSYKADLGGEEKAEAEFIKHVYSTWTKTKPTLLQLIKVLERNWGSNNTKKEKGYFN